MNIQVEHKHDGNVNLNVTVTVKHEGALPPEKLAEDVKRLKDQERLRHKTKEVQYKHFGKTLLNVGQVFFGTTLVSYLFHDKGDTINILLFVGGLVISALLIGFGLKYLKKSVKEEHALNSEKEQTP